MEVILATNNVHKVKEIKSLLPEIKILTLKEIGFNADIEETGTTFLENALIKAKTIYDIFKKPVISDDSGLCVEALDLKPGVYSHRYSGLDATDDTNNQLLITNLKGIENRNAYYETVICFYNGSPHYFSGKVYGQIHDEAKGINGFGYDPHFYLSQFNKTMAELTLEEKNKISHRAQALNKLKEYLNEASIYF